MRSWGSCLLGYFPERTADTMPFLKRMLEVERDPRVAATAAISSGLIADRTDAELAFLLDRRLCDSSQLESWGAAIGLAWSFGRSDRLVAEALSNCISSSSGIRCNVPFNEGNISAIARHVLR